MPNCDMCGKSTEQLLFALVEGTELSLCKNCISFGKPIKRKNNATAKDRSEKKKKETHGKEIIDSVVTDFFLIIKKKREELGLKQKELAVKLAERESLMQKIETGHIRPSLKLAAKLEKILGVALIEKIETDDSKVTEKKYPSNLTIGDMIKIK